MAYYDDDCDAPEYDDDCDAPEYDDDCDASEQFAQPGGRSALRCATRHNPRNLPCPTCHAENKLTAADRAHGYQCDDCADKAEGRGEY